MIEIKAASNDERALAVHACWGMLLSGVLHKCIQGKTALHVWAIWSRWQIFCGSYNELMVLWQSIKMDRSLRCDVSERFWKFCPQMLLAKFVANRSTVLGGVRKSKFINFSQSLSGSWGSSHLGFMSFGQTNEEICNTLCFEQNVKEVVI